MNENKCKDMFQPGSVSLTYGDAWIVDQVNDRQLSPNSPASLSLVFNLNVRRYVHRSQSASQLKQSCENNKVRLRCFCGITLR